MKPMQRHLDMIESSFQIIQMGLVPIGVEYFGEINVETLKDAFRKLCISHPVLRAQVIQDGNQYLLRVPDDFFPEMTISDGDASTIFRECIDAESQADGRVMQPILVRSRGDSNRHGYVAMGVDHSIIDAAAVFQYIRELWQMYVVFQNGETVDSEPGTSLPLSPHDLLLERWPAYATKFGDRDSSIDRGSARPDQSVLPTGIVQSVYFSPEETDAVLETCKSNSISVGSFLGGVMATTLRSYNDNNGPIPIRFNIRTDARNRVEPKIDPTETTFIVVDIPAVINVEPQENPIKTATRLNEKIKHITDNFSLVSFNYSEIGELDIVLNNSGNIPAFISPDGIKILDVIGPLLQIRETIEKNEDEGLLRELNRRTLCITQRNKCTMSSLSYNRKLRVMFKMREDVPSNTIDKFKERVIELATADQNLAASEPFPT